MKDTSDQVTAVARALSLLECFLEKNAPAMTLNELSKESGLYKSTCIRLLQTLQNYQYVERLDSGEYRVDYKALRIASLYQNGVQPHEIITPVLRKLVSETGESASYNVARNNHRVCIYRIDSPNRIRDNIRAGDIFPITRGAVGSVLQAFTDREEPKFEQVRKSMLAVSLGSVDPDTAGMAIPVFGVRNEMEGTVAISGPLARFELAKLIGFAESLFDAAIDITNKMGGDTTTLKAAKINLSGSESIEESRIKIMN